MDQGPATAGRDSLALTGLGVALGTPCDPAPYLRNRKLRKFMGVQDDLAVVAAGRALDSAGLRGLAPSERTGLYLAVGYIPFDADDLDRLHDSSVADGRLSMERFSTDAYDAVNPLLTFRCLPNMPAFHMSVNFDVQGPYFVTYPGPGQFYLALDAAVAALEAGAIDVALVGGVAHQRNFLVIHHHRRLDPPVPAEALADGAGCLVLEARTHAQARGAPIRGHLLALDIAYEPHDPFGAMARPVVAADAEDEFGAAALPIALAQRGAGIHRHQITARDGIVASSAWQLP